jgi:spore coat protein U-like protein
VAQAQTSFNVAVSATISNACTVAATPVSFGTYLGNVGAPTVDATGQITVRCRSGNAYDVRLNNGNNAAGSQRRMLQTAGTALLDYALFKDAARTQRWGNNNAERLSGVGTGAAQVLTVYARLPGAQVVPFGAYVDTITVTVQY